MLILSDKHLSAVRGKLADLPRTNFAEVVELADTYGSGPYAEKLEGSNPSLGTAKFGAGRTGFRSQRSQGHRSSNLLPSTNV